MFGFLKRFGLGDKKIGVSMDLGPDVNPFAAFIERRERELNELNTIPPEWATHIIIHHSLTPDSGTVSWDAIRRYHTQYLGWSDIGYHFGIERVGDDVRIFAGRPMERHGAHVKDGGFNTRSIGICVVGNYDLEEPSPEHILAAGMLCRRLMNFGTIPPAAVLGHREAQSQAGVPEHQRKTCPGGLFSMSKFRTNLRHGGFT